MIVYIVIHGENHEGSSIVGVYSTKEMADKKAKRESRGISSCEYVDVLKWKVDVGKVVKKSPPMTDEERAKWLELNRPFFEAVTKSLANFEPLKSALKKSLNP